MFLNYYYCSENYKSDEYVPYYIYILMNAYQISTWV